MNVGRSVTKEVRLTTHGDPAEHYAEIRADLKGRGIPIGSNGLMIAAHARSLDATLVTNNVREFRRVPGLRVENWAA